MNRSDIAGFLILGLAIGWLVGLSMSPVVGGVLAGITGAAASLVAALSSKPNDTPGAAQEMSIRIAPSPWALVVLVLGIAAGAPVGVKVRELGVLGTTAAATGLHGSIAPADCALLWASDLETLGQDFRKTGDPTLQAIGRHVANVAALDSIRGEVCKKP